jgi:hypothetical protein
MPRMPDLVVKMPTVWICSVGSPGVPNCSFVSGEGRRHDTQAIGRPSSACIAEGIGIMWDIAYICGSVPMIPRMCYRNAHSTVKSLAHAASWSALIGCLAADGIFWMRSSGSSAMGKGRAERYHYGGNWEVPRKPSMPQARHDRFSRCAYGR